MSHVTTYMVSEGVHHHVKIHPSQQLQRSSAVITYFLVLEMEIMRWAMMMTTGNKRKSIDVTTGLICSSLSPCPFIPPVVTGVKCKAPLLLSSSRQYYYWRTCVCVVSAVVVVAGKKKGFFN